MAIDSHYIPAFSIEDVILDKDTGAPLSGGLVYFEEDNNRGVLKPVYQITGTSPDYSYTQLPNPMVLSSIGTFEDSLDNPTVPYFYPYDANLDPDLYYVRVTSSTDVPQFDREAVPYIPNSGGTELDSAFVNELSNPQFAQVLFDTTTTSYTYNFNAVSQERVTIAPGWEIVVSCAGAGTVTVKQITPLGSLNRITNPGTILDISSSGLSRLRLCQRLYGSPNLWGGGYLAASFIAKTFSGTTPTLTLLYSQSNGTVTDEALVTATLTADGNYNAFPGSILIPASDSTDSFPDAYIDIEFAIPLSIEIAISSVMLAGTGTVSVDSIVYDQTSLDRQIDQLFHYYQPLINFKPIPNMLTGWDFPLNPAQAGSSGNIGGAWQYVWDQTLSARGSTGNVTYARNSITSGLQFTTTNVGPDAWILSQYLTGAQAKKMIGTKLSVNMNAFKTVAGSDILFKIYLFRGSSAAVVPTLGNAIGTLSFDGGFTKNNTAGQGLNWTYIQRGNQSDSTGVATGTLNVVTTNDELNGSDNDYGFFGWEVTDPIEIGDTDKFCIIITFAYTTTATVATVNSVAVVPGDIPTRPAPQSLDEVLRECQYYYQKSFLVGTVPAQNVGAGTEIASQVVLAGNAGNGPVVRFTVPMRATPTVTLYNPAAANAQIRGNVADWTNSAASTVSTQGFVATGSAPGGSTQGQSSFVQWLANAQLGIV